jgi:uncharacterized protein (TIGR02679 family)
MICAEGRPSLAAVRLLTHLTQTGVQLRYHGDFDWDGLSIADQVMNLGAKPWRMGPDDYLELLTVSGRLAALSPEPVSGPGPTWAPGLHAVMSTHQRQGEEEHIIDRLLADLSMD